MTKLNDAETEKGHKHIQWLTAILVNTTLFTYGVQLSWISPTAKLLQSESSPTGIPLTDTEISWMASVICLSAVFGVPACVLIADSLGRKAAIVSIAVFQGLAWALKLSYASFASYLVARILCGVAAAGCFNVVPIYVKEISEDSVRGLLGSLLILSQNVGMLLGYALGAYLNYYTVLWIALCVPLLSIPLLLRAPESPAFLVKVGRLIDAENIIAYLRGLEPKNKIVQNEIMDMKNQDEYFKSIPNVSFLTIFQEKAWRRGFLRVLLIMTLQSSNGSVTITVYAASILADSGVTVSPELQSLSFPAVMILGSFLSMSCVDRIGRKPLLAASFLLVAISMVALGCIVLIQHQGGSVPAWLSVVSLIGTVTGYATGVSPVVFIMMSEMFNFQVRAKLLGCLVSYAWFLAFIQIFAFSPISNAFGLYTAFYGFGIINVLGTIATLVLLPETNGKTVEQIEAELRK